MKISFYTPDDGGKSFSLRIPTSMTFRIVTSDMALRIASKNSGESGNIPKLSPQARTELIDKLKRFKQSHRDFTMVEASSSDGVKFTLILIFV